MSSDGDDSPTAARPPGAAPRNGRPTDTPPATAAPATVRTRDSSGETAGSFAVVQDGAGRAALALDEAVGELRFHPAELARLVEDRTVALIAAHEEIEQAHRRRQDLHDRMRILSTRLGATGLEAVDLPSTLREIAAAVGQVLEVDVVAIYTAPGGLGLEEVPVVWHPGPTAPATDRSLALTDGNRRFVEAVAERQGTLALTGDPALPASPGGIDGTAFAGTTGYAAWILSPVHDADGRLLAVLGLARVEPVDEWNDDDIALVDSVGADLGRAIVQASVYERQTEVVRQLQDLDRAKSEFLSTFSHELRTPLTSIRAYTELLRDDVVDSDQVRMLQIIEENSVRLSVLIEDILTLSHLNAAVNDITLVPVDLDPLVRSVCESLLATAEARGLTLTVRTGPRGAPVLGDANELERLLLNLVSNAVKFTPAGGAVVVSTSASGDSVVLSVADTGIGIPAAEHEAVFGRFVRGSEATREFIPGTGLGLAIVQAVVEHHGGALHLASAPGQGTTVRVRLPSLDAGDGTAARAQARAASADTEPEDLVPAGARRSGAGESGPVADLRSPSHSKEHPR